MSSHLGLSENFFVEEHLMNPFPEFLQTIAISSGLNHPIKFRLSLYINFLQAQETKTPIQS